jgi:Ice-binding-like
MGVFRPQSEEIRMRSPRRRRQRLETKPAASTNSRRRHGGKTGGVGLASIVTAASLLFAGSAEAANPPVKLGSDSSFSVLAGSTVTNTGPTIMFGDLGLDPGSSVTGAPHVLGAMHIDDGVAVKAKSDLVTGYNDAAGRPSTHLSSADLSGQTFTPGVYDASSSLLFSAGSVTLNAKGDPNAVFIFQVGSSITTGSATTVLLTNGAQPCNVFWQVGASVTLGSNSTFAGTVMALTTITAKTGAKLDGRLLARNGAVNLDTNIITTSACSTSTKGGTTGGGTTGTTGGGTTGTTGGGTTGTTGGGTTGTGPNGKPIGSVNTTNRKKRAAARRARHAAQQRRARRLAKQRRARRLALARARRAHKSPARRPTGTSGFTG